MKHVKMASVVKLPNSETNELETHVRSTVVIQFPENATDEQMISEARNMTIFQRKKLGWDPFAGNEIIILEQTVIKTGVPVRTKAAPKAKKATENKPKTAKIPKDKPAKPAKVSSKKSDTKPAKDPKPKKA
jgi:hypothetical protein